MRRAAKEIARLVRVTRSLGSFSMHDGEENAWSFYCPVHREALNGIGERGLAHRFPVHHLPWEHKASVALVTKALVHHLDDADENGEPCDNPLLAPR